MSPTALNSHVKYALVMAEKYHMVGDSKITER